MPPYAIGKVANAFGKAMITSWPPCAAMARAATPMRPHAGKLRREAADGVRLGPKDSVALGGDNCAWAGVRGFRVVNQGPADHMENAEPENKGGYQGLCAQSLPANPLSARWPCVNATGGDPELCNILGYFASEAIVLKMWVAANNLHRLASS
jgi:hypothetical protein